MYTKTFFTLVIVAFVSLLSACDSQPTPTITFTPIPSPTETRTPKPSLTWTPLPSSTSTLAPTPPPNPLLISYRTYAGDGVDEYYSCLHGYYSPEFQLYKDGFLVRFDDEYLAAQLSDDEVNELLNRISSTGFFETEGTGELVEDDPIYRYEGPWVGDGGFSSVLSVLDRRVNIYAPLGEYLITPVEETLEIIWGYSHDDEAPYKPNRLGMYIQALEAQYSDGIEIKEFLRRPAITIQGSWPAGLPPLSKYVEENYILYFEGEELEKLLEVFPVIPSYGIFFENDQAFLVVACAPERQHNYKLM